jgi:hypothetical protein
MTTKPISLLDCAKNYLGRGWSVIPLKERSKEAAVRWKEWQDKRPDDDQLAKWFTGKERNLAVVLGLVSGGLTVCDFDKAETYHAWAGRYPELAKTLPTVRSGRGFHVYFHSQLTKSSKFNGGDLKASGYIVLPPSIHPSGVQYVWQIRLNGGLPELDPFTWNLDRLTEHTEHTEQTENAENTEAMLENVEVCESEKNVENDTPSSYLASVSLSSLSSVVETSIAETVPNVEGTRNFQLFQFARRLQGIPELAGCDPKRLRPLVKEWHRRALPHISTKDFDETWADFLFGWPRVRYAGVDALKKAIQSATVRTYDLKCLADYEGERTRFLICVCYELHKASGGSPWWMSCRDAAEILAKTHETANKFLHMFEKGGVLQAVDRKAGGKKATRYRFTGE